MLCMTYNFFEDRQFYANLHPSITNHYIGTVPEYKFYASVYRSDMTPKISIEEKCF